jgi:ornithine cyclodeaminase/alanine dehydrogenase-like protein (mu-crystallin family)
MKIVVLNYAEILELLPMGECIDAMSEVLAALARDEAHNPLRSVVHPPDTGHFLGLMPAYRGGDNPAYALKEVCVFPDNPMRGLDAHQGSVLLHSAETGELMAVMNGSAITEIRTAAVSALATKLLARDDAKEVAIVGTGVQGRSHLHAMAALNRFVRVRVCSLRAGRAAAFAKEFAASMPFAIEPVDDVQSAVASADVINTTTNAREPIVKREWIQPGAHINAVGSSIPWTRELDTATVAAATLFVDRRESTLNEAGDYLMAAKEGAIGPDHIRAELGEILVGNATGRSSAEEITLFKSLGIAVEDLASAQFLYARALERGVGTRIDF